MDEAYSPLKVYIASRFPDRDDCLYLKGQLEARGYQVTSTWLTPADGNSANMATLRGKHVECRQRAIKDIEDIKAADVVVLMSPKKAHRNGTGGRHVECGISIALGKPIILVGERENVFHYHPLVRVVGDEMGVYGALGA